MTYEEHQNHKRWIRGCLGFKYLGEGLVQTVDTIVKKQYDDFVKNLKCSGCDQCSLNTLLPSHSKVSNKCPKERSKCFCFVYSRNRRPCPNSFCGHVYDSIVTNYSFSEPNWSNTDLTKWGSNYFEIAKCYIGSAGYKDKQNIQDIDCSGLLNIIINNRAFENSITKGATSLNHFIQARDDRNFLFHSPNMELSEDRLISIVDNMLFLLKLPEIIDTDGKTRSSIENIQKIRDGNIYVSARDEKQVEKECIRKQQEYNQRKEELQTQLCEYYERCLSTIPVSPVLKTISGTVDEVFVEFSIGTNLTGKQNAEDFEQVIFYKEILFKNGTLCKSVYLLGEAGMGKTTWCKKFLNTWINACKYGSGRFKSSIESKADETSRQNEKQVNEADADLLCLRQFDILFYIALRQESKHIPITEMIKHHPVVAEYTMQSVVEDVLKNEPQSCIILLDGLDEWEPDEDAEIPSREGLHGCTVVTTSRKYRLVGINATDDSFCPDRVVEMTGIRNKELLVKNVIRQLNIVMRNGREKDVRDSSEEDSKRFIADVKKMRDREISYQKTLPGYLDIPLMLIVMVCLWFDMGEIEDTITKNIAGMIEFMFRYAEGFQPGFRKKKQKSEVIIENLNDLKKEWSRFAETLPSKLKQRKILVNYGGLVSKVSKFAFDSLFNAKLKIRLTFSKRDLLEYFSEDELHVIMKIGILSQSEVTESVLCPMTKLSFIHKLFHEYLAGVYLTMQFLSRADEAIETVNMLANYFKDPVGNHLSNIDNATCFVGGIDPVAGSKMSEMLFNALKVSPEVFNTHSLYFNTFFLRQVQVVYENDEKYPSIEFPIYTEFISVPNQLAEGKMKYLHILLKTNIKNLREVEIPGETAPEILENFRDDTILEKLMLCIYDVIPKIHCASLIRSLHCLPELQSLEFRGFSKVSSESSNEFVCFDFTSTRLKRLELKDLSSITILVNCYTEVVCDDSTKYEIKIQNEK